MELYIEVDENGNCVNHPILGDNLRYALEIDPVTHHKYEQFARVTFAESGLEAKLLQKPVCSYQKINGIWTDVWEIVDLVDEELEEKIKSLDDHVKGFKDYFINKITELMKNETSSSKLDEYQNYINSINNWIPDYNAFRILYPEVPLDEPSLTV